MMSNFRNVGPSLHKAANCAGRHTVAEANIDGEFEVIGGTPSFTEDPPGARAEVDPPRAVCPDIGAVPTFGRHRAYFRPMGASSPEPDLRESAARVP